MRRALALIAAGALALAACADDDDGFDRAADTETAPGATAPTTVVATTTSSTITPTTTASPSTTDPAVPVDVQDAYREAGQRPLTEEDFETFTSRCEGLQRQDEEYLAAFDRRDDDDQATILKNLEPLCPGVVAKIEGRTTQTTGTESDGFSRDAVVAVERCLGELGSIREVVREIGELASFGSGYDEMKKACDEASLQTRIDASPRSPEAEVSLAVHEINLELSMLPIYGMKDGGITDEELDDYTDTVAEKIEAINEHPQISSGWLG